MKNNSIFSHHIFYFSFEINNETAPNINNENEDTVSWIRISRDKSNTMNEELFDICSYFHPFVLDSILDNNNEMLEHYECREADSKGKENNVKFIVDYIKEESNLNKCKTYILDIEKITIDIFQQRIGILSIYTKNSLYSQIEDICNINSLFRYLYKPYWNYNKISNIRFEGLSGSTTNKFIDEPIKAVNSWELSKHIGMLINDFATAFPKYNKNVQPVFDNKMFVSSWFYNEELAKNLQHANINDLRDSTFWQNYIFMDTNNNGYGTCNEDMRGELTKKASYLRWQNNGTLYGISTEGFVCLTNYKDTLKTMRTIYPYIIRIILLQRASLLSLSNDISKFSNSANLNNINKIYKAYIKYVENLYFKEVTPQIQGMELYEKLQETFKLKTYFFEYNYEIGKIHNFLQTKEEAEKKEDQNNILNFIAAIFLPGSLIAGLFGMNAASNQWGFKNELLCVCLASVIFLLIFIAHKDYRRTIMSFVKEIKTNWKSKNKHNDIK